MKRYRLRTLLGGRLWPWRESRKEAVQDAIDADMAWEEDGRVWYDPFVRIEEVEAAND